MNTPEYDPNSTSTATDGATTETPTKESLVERVEEVVTEAKLEVAAALNTVVEKVEGVAKEMVGEIEKVFDHNAAETTVTTTVTSDTPPAVDVTTTTGDQPVSSNDQAADSAGAEKPTE